MSMCLHLFFIVYTYIRKQSQFFQGLLVRAISRVHTYVFILRCMYRYLCIHMNIHIFRHIHIRIGIHVCLCVYTYIRRQS